MANLPAQEHFGRRVLRYAVCYLVWLGLTAWLAWMVFWLRGLVVEVMMWLRVSPWAVRGFDRWSIFVLGLLWLAAMLWLESYLRGGTERGLLWRRAVRVGLAFGLAMAVGYTAQAAIRWGVGVSS